MASGVFRHCKGLGKFWVSAMVRAWVIFRITIKARFKGEG
jgi:hypothetical protein